MIHLPIQTIMNLLIVLFFVLLLLPIAWAAYYFYTKKGEILHINQNRVKDPRYFGKSFSAMVESHLDDVVDDTIKLSRPEAFINSDKDNVYSETVTQLVIGTNKEFNCPKEIKEFQKEIYCKESIIFNSGKKEIRAAYSKENMIVGDDITIGRWIDAQGTVAIYDNCDLGISASSKSRMSIGKNCKFRRLFAPEICIGQYPDDIKNPMDTKDERIYRLPVQTNKKRNVKYINAEMINEEGVVNFSVLSWKNVMVTENVIVQGDVRSHKGVRLFENAVICGNVFAEENVILGKNACILGNVFSQGSIILEEGAVVGQRERICSLIARKDVTFGGDNFVYGYVVCERNGTIVPKTIEEEYSNEEEVVKENIVQNAAEDVTTENIEENNSSKSLQFLDKEPSTSEITFKNLEDFLNVDKQGFRFNKAATKVTIPDGAVKIRKSMFFHCMKLKTICLPKTIQKINDYAFADCEELTQIEGFEECEIRGIRTSAFEGCINLKTITIPKTAKFIGGAAFKGCTSLEKVEMDENSVLRWIDDHSFSNCSSLKSIYLPKTVENIGVSAFIGCTSLKEIHIPEHCKNCAGILECDPKIIKVYKSESDTTDAIQQEVDFAK